MASTPSAVVEVANVELAVGDIQPTAGLENALSHLQVGVEPAAAVDFHRQAAEEIRQAREVPCLGLQLDFAAEKAQRRGAPVLLRIEGVEVPREAIAKQIFESLEPIMASEDAAEGVQSFIERRKAVFTGR